jgi:hypothetical protein
MMLGIIATATAALTGSSPDDSPLWIAAIVVGAALLLAFILILGGPRDDHRR